MIRIGTTASAITCIMWLAAGCREQCKDPIVVTYPVQTNAYLKAYKPGSWWVYVSGSGTRDSVYLTDFKEYRDEQSRRGGPCYVLPEVRYVIKSASMDETSELHARYGCVQEGTITSWHVAPTSNWPQTFGFGYHSAEGYSHAHVMDTTIGGTSYAQALSVRAGSSPEVRQLRSLCLAKDIGIVAYITATDTFTVTTYSIP